MGVSVLAAILAAILWLSVFWCVVVILQVFL